MSAAKKSHPPELDPEIAAQLAALSATRVRS